MAEAALTLSDGEALVAEIERLRAQVAWLEQRVAQLDRLAHRDALVDLPNRRCFIASLEALIARVERYGDKAAMLFVDLDGLKRINDQFGHAAGDEALVQVARMLVESVRRSDYVARIGGDEFGILLERIDEQGAWQMALRIVETVVRSQYCVDGRCLPLSVAVGVGKINADDDPQSVIARADKEMYRVKAA
jgi:diguanylate cyclase (GGDEF)-like protein